MALADYYDRSATAASQVISGFDPEQFRALLGDTTVGISFGDDAATTTEGRAALDLLVRLVARLYPHLDIRPVSNASTETTQVVRTLRALARRINPNVDLRRGGADVGLAVGVAPSPWAETFYVGCSAWSGSISTTKAQVVGKSTVIFGAGVAACLASAAVFRRVLTPTEPAPGNATLSVFGDSPVQLPNRNLPRKLRLPDRAMLVGAGAIGQAVTWALARTRIEGRLIIVDPETVDLGNAQRYVVTTRGDVDGIKASLAAAHINRVGTSRGGPRIHAVPLVGTYAQALAEHGFEWDAALAALDSSGDRRAVQSTLPHWVANAWTQTGDLGVSDHHFLDGACVACLYLPPPGQQTNEDEIVARALGLFPDHLMAVRTLLHLDQPVPEDLADVIADRLQIDPSLVRPYAAKGIRALYVDGVCGGGLIPLGSRQADGHLHVPLAHQSALAGVLLAARLVRRALGEHLDTTEVMRVDLTRELSANTVQNAGKDPRGICTCQDREWVTAYQDAWST